MYVHLTFLLYSVDKTGYTYAGPFDGIPAMFLSRFLYDIRVQAVVYCCMLWHALLLLSAWLRWVFLLRH